MKPLWMVLIMKKINNVIGYKISVFLLFAISMLLSNLISVSALEFGGISVLKEIDVPKNLNFTVRDTCAKYDHFMQATAREDGCFAVYARQVDTGDRYIVDFEKVYIDIYNSEGDFYQELCFTTSQDLAVELTQETVNIYFYNSILVYNLETQKIHNYAIPDGEAVDGEVYKNLRKEEFISGDWNYSCKKSFGEYTQLIRQNEDNIQIPVQLEGTENNFAKAFFPSLGIAFLGFLFRKWLKRVNQRTGGRLA